MRFGITILPEYRWSEAEPKWRRAEELGFDHAWTYDHLTWGGLQDSPWYGDPDADRGGAGHLHDQARHLVTSPNFRHPLALTRELLALDDISNGRFLCGIGSGGGIDSTILGGDDLTPRQKVDRLEEFTELLDKLLTTDKVDFKGEYFETRNGRTLPGCIQQPRVPFIMAANGPRSLRLATRYGAGWVTTGPKSDDFETWIGAVGDLSHRLDDLLEGRPFDRYLALDSARYSLTSAAAFEDVVGRAASLGFTDVITHWPRAEGVYAGTEEVLEQVVAEVIPRLR